MFAVQDGYKLSGSSESTKPRISEAGTEEADRCTECDSSRPIADDYGDNPEAGNEEE